MLQSVCLLISTTTEPTRFNAAQLYMDGLESRSHVVKSFGRENRLIERFNLINTPRRIKLNVS
jgi:hypothetical protein